MARKYKDNRLLQIAAQYQSLKYFRIFLLDDIFIRISCCTQSCCPFSETQACLVENL